MDLASVLNTTSGLDALVQQYMAMESRPLTRLQNNKSSLNIQSALYDDLLTKIQAFKTFADALAETESDSIYNALSVTSTDSSVIGATTTSGAAQGTYVFRVRQIATATRMKSTDELNSSPSTMSSSQVVAGSDELDTSKSFAEAGFDDSPTGSISIKTGPTWVEFDLDDYSTVDAFMDAINTNEDVDANIYYDETRDKFIIEKVGNGGQLQLKQSTADGFLTQAKIATDTSTHEYSTNVSGLQTNEFLYEVNFDEALSESDSGSFKINGATIEWDAGEDTLNDIISRINSSTAGVTAFYDDSLDKVMITSKILGSEEIVFEDVEGSFLADTLKFSGVDQEVGQDAKFTINSTSDDDEMTKSSNTFTINGITFDLKTITVENDEYDDPSTTSVTITVSQNISALENKINNFLAGMNALNSYIKSKSTTDTETYSRGALAGNTVFTNLRTQLISTILDRVSGLDSENPQYLSEIGITVDSNLNASLSDSTALQEKLADNPQAVADLFNSTNGVATQIVDLLEAFVDSDGIISGEQENIQDQIERIDNQIDSLEDFLARKEEYYRGQLASMQTILNDLVRQQNMVSNLFRMNG